MSKICVRGPTTKELKEMSSLIEAYEFWMKDGNAVGISRGLLAPCSARAIAEHVLDEHWALIERFIPN
jgi:hypothetical protein